MCRGSVSSRNPERHDLTLMACLLDRVSNGTFQRERERGIELHMTAGETRWQVGTVERDVAVFAEMLTKLASEEQEDSDPHLVLWYAVEAKNIRGICNEYSMSVVLGT